jgi:hypothetical protein
MKPTHTLLLAVIAVPVFFAAEASAAEPVVKVPSKLLEVHDTPGGFGGARTRALKAAPMETTAGKVAAATAIGRTWATRVGMLHKLPWSPIAVQAKGDTKAVRIGFAKVAGVTLSKGTVRSETHPSEKIGTAWTAAAAVLAKDGHVRVTNTEEGGTVMHSKETASERALAPYVFGGNYKGQSKKATNIRTEDGTTIDTVATVKSGDDSRRGMHGDSDVTARIEAPQPNGTRVVENAHVKATGGWTDDYVAVKEKSEQPPIVAGGKSKR